MGLDFNSTVLAWDRSDEFLTISISIGVVKTDVANNTDIVVRSGVPDGKSFIYKFGPDGEFIKRVGLR